MIKQHLMRNICTSRISLILAPPLPIIDPHWLAGTTKRRVIGGIVVHVCFRSLKKLRKTMRKSLKSNKFCHITSSNFWQIISKALDNVSIVPTIVTIRSGVVPSLIFIRAPLWKRRECLDYFHLFNNYFFSNSFDIITTFANDTSNFLKSMID